jgi:hypothetical protein
MRKLVLILVLFLCYGHACAGDRVTLSGYLKQEASVGLRTFNNITKFKNTVQLSGEYKLNDKTAFFMSTKYWYDAVYDWYDKFDTAQDQMGHVQRTDWLRDCYLDYTHGPWFLRLGKQQVAWGQADGITILDRVNPSDLSEYWLPDMVDIRIPLWMANINYSPKLNSNLQVLIIPDFEQSNAAPPDAPFAFRSYKMFKSFKDSWENDPNPFGGAPKFLRGVVNTNIYYPAKQFENSKFGLQWQDRVGDLEYTLNYLYGYDYLARTYLDKIDYNNFPFQAVPRNFNYSRRFSIVQMAGGSINKSFTNTGPLQGITLRGDYAVYINEPTYYGDTTARGVNRWNNTFWLIGIDKYVVTNWLASFQFSQYIMEHAHPGVSNPSYYTLNSYTYGQQDRIENIFSLKIATDFMNERLKPEILWSFTDDNQGRLSPKVTYEIKDNLFFTAGIHYFYGKETDSNGQFRDISQIYGNLKYTF